MRSSERATRDGRATRRLARRAALGAVLFALSLSALPLSGQSRPSAGGIYIIPIRGEINDITRDSVQRRVSEAREAGARALVFEMDTPGGLVTSARDICALIKNLPAEIHTVAWVNHDAISAGAMISVACREIVVAPVSTIGDCAPIMIGMEQIGEVEREKVESVIRSEFTGSAQQNGHDPELLLAMVTRGREVWWIERTDGGARRFVGPAEKRQLIDDVVLDQRQWRLVERYSDPVDGRPVNVAQPVCGEKELLTLTGRQAVGYGLATAIVGDDAQLASQLGVAGTPHRLEVSGWEAFAQWLNNPLIRGVLFLIFVVGATLEFKYPGTLIPAGVALVALLIFLAAPYAAGLADIWTLALLVIGLILLGIELFVLPGFGVVGLLGALLILVALVGTFVPREPSAPPFSLPTLPATWAGLKTGVITMSLSLLAAVTGLVFLTRYLPDSWLGRRLLLANPAAGPALAAPDPREQVQVGEIGEVLTPLRPGGRARFGDLILDVQSETAYVEVGERVKVVRHEGMMLFVRPLA